MNPQLTISSVKREVNRNTTEVDNLGTRLVPTTYGPWIGIVVTDTSRICLPRTSCTEDRGLKQRLNPKKLSYLSGLVSGGLVTSH